MLDSLLMLISFLASSAGMLAGIGLILCLCVISDKRKDDDTDA